MRSIKLFAAALCAAALCTACVPEQKTNVNLDPDARKTLRDRCKDPRELAALTALPQKSGSCAKWLPLPASKVENYHSEHYAAYSH